MLFGMMQTFKCAHTQILFERHSGKRFKVFERVALRKLVQLHAATTLEFLRVPPGNQLEALMGDRLGQHCIRINDQWRPCFIWRDGEAFDVEIVDDH
jgi:toxin HigB-1